MRKISTTLAVLLFLAAIVFHHFRPNLTDNVKESLKWHLLTDQYIKTVITECECVEKIPFRDPGIFTGEYMFFNPTEKCLQALQEAKKHSDVVKNGVCEVNHYENQSIDLAWGMWCHPCQTQNTPSAVLKKLKQCNRSWRR